ncbi:MAG TPA: DUF6504 family protein [Gammaproteobacteria bacterium]|nr:DUF6504 family protein [Gammaproteobacteria bacterium]
MHERFVSERITPLADSHDTGRMALGEPGLPREFTWRGQTVRVASVLRTWRDTGPCRHGSGERYVRKHWYEVRTDDGRRMKLYFDRKPRGRALSPRWWLYSVSEPDGTH